MKLLFVFAVLFSSGCMTMMTAMHPDFPGNVAQTKSEIDGRQETIMYPGWCGSTLKIGLFKTNLMSEKEVLMIIEVDKAVNFGDELTVKVDDKTHQLTALPELTTRGIVSAGAASHNKSQRRYKATMDIVESMIAAKTLLIRAPTLSGYFEDKCVHTGLSSAIAGFKDFKSKLTLAPGS